MRHIRGEEDQDVTLGAVNWKMITNLGQLGQLLGHQDLVQYTWMLWMKVQHVSHGRCCLSACIQLPTSDGDLRCDKASAVEGR